MLGEHRPGDTRVVPPGVDPRGPDAPSTDAPDDLPGVVLHGDLDLAGCERWAVVLQDAVDALAEGEDLVVDARDVAFADCTGLRLLVSAAVRARGRLVLRAPSRAVTRVLAATGGATALLVEAPGEGGASGAVLGSRARGRADAVEAVPRREGGDAGAGGTGALRAACAQLAAWDDALGARGPHRVAVRLEEEELAHAGTPGRVRVALAEHGLDPERLVLLVGAPSDAAPALRSAVERLRGLGCEVRALDGSPLP